jgi:hypothetical protein
VLEDYLKHFKSVSDWNQWNDDDRAGALVIALTGDAADFLYSQPNSENANFVELCDMLGGRFGAARTIAVDKKKLRERRKEKGESYAHLGQDILRLTRRVYKGAPALAEQESRDAFIRALPSNLRMAVAAANPLTLNECIDNVTQLCAIMDPDEDTVETSKRVRRVNKGQQQKTETNEEKESETGPKISKLWCWDCGKSGHMRNKCPEHFKFKPADWVDRPRKPQEKYSDNG